MSPLLEMNYLNSPSTQASLFIWDRKEKAVLAYANASSQAVKILKQIEKHQRGLRNHRNDNAFHLGACYFSQLGLPS